MATLATVQTISNSYFEALATAERRALQQDFVDINKRAAPGAAAGAPATAVSTGVD